jgi:GNAT superfamily N-acetyltransferase
MFMFYRATVENDLPALRTLAVLSYGQLKPNLTQSNWNKLEALLLSDDNFPVLLQTCYGFVCEEENELFGMAFLVPNGNPTKIYSSETSIIRMVGVHPGAGGKGIAQTLTRLCMKKAEQTGEKKISLHSAEVMYAARHIYEKLGFKKIRLLDEHYGLAYWLYELEIVDR